MKKRFIALLLAASFLLCSCSGTTENSAVSSDASSGTTSSSAETTKEPETETTTTEKSEAETTTTVATKPENTTTATPEPETTTVVTPKPETTTATPKPETSTTVAVKPETTTTASPKPETTTTKKPVTTTTPVTTTKKPIVIPEGAEMSDLTPEQRYYVYGIDGDKQQEYYKTISNIKLPVIHISTENKQHILSREDYVNCLVDVFNCDEEYKLDAEYAGIRVRGNSTAHYGDEAQILRDQVPYRIKFDKKTNMLGLNDGAECKSWVLLKSQWNVMPDYIAFKLAEAIMNGEYYSSDCTFAYVYVNKSFKGLYLLCEQNQINKNRVNLPEHEEGYTGTDIGYFLELDNYAAENPYWFTMDYCGETLTDLEGTTRQLVPAEYTIKNDIYSQEQVDFISQYLSDVYKIMIQAIKYEKYYTFDENYKLIDASGIYDNAYDTINAVVDLKSVVNMYILYEICHDNDCGEGSFYMAIDFSGQSSFNKLTFTAPWDFNWAYGDSATGRYYAGAFNDMSFVNQYGDRTNPWFVLLMGTDWFKELVKEKWNEMYGAGEITSVLSGCRETINKYWDEFTVKKYGAYPECAEDLLKWVMQRVVWLNKQWKN
ncbi:MAG: CotH kinase family protein [Ruminiclostridium sp.]|nr:CotH kinase family protein [Ruminiclostridium sp.]